MQSTMWQARSQGPARLIVMYFAACYALAGSHLFLTLNAGRTQEREQREQVEVPRLAQTASLIGKSLLQTEPAQFDSCPEPVLC